MTDVEFYFDYNSPYSYFASHLIEGVCERQGATLRWKPIVLGGVFKALAHTPSFQLEQKGAYLWADLEDLSAYHRIPYRRRRTFLFNPIVSLRATLAAGDETDRSAAVHALFRGAFAEDRDLGEAGEVIALLNEAGLDGAHLVAQTQRPELKHRLREETDEAIRRGIFGVPTFFAGADGKMFWGHDRLPLLEHYLMARNRG